MIRAARSRHRVMVVALALVVPALVVAGLMSRQPIPRTETAAAAADGGGFGELGEQTRGSGLPVRVVWLRAPAPVTRWAVRLTLEGPLERPDVLVYWDERAGDAPAAVSEAARLLGRLGGRHEVVWEVPEPIRGGGLVFYSTAWQEVVGSVSPPSGWSDAP